MPADVVLVDTGPLVALLDPSDRGRARCRSLIDRLDHSDLVTTEAAVTEAEYLLDFSGKAQAALMHLLASGRPRVETIASTDRPRIAELMARYADLPMDYRLGRRRFEILG